MKRVGAGVLLAAGLVIGAAAGSINSIEVAGGVEGLERCDGIPRARCGTIVRQLDPNNPAAGTIEIAFELHQASRTNRPLLGTIVAVEGGPGYATTDSRDYYLELFAPLLDRRQLLLIDNRGTGGSAAIDCPELQSYVGDYNHNVRLCGRTLGANSDVWGTGPAADDMAAVLDHLGLDTVDLYGDSYGTFFGQVFAIRHPQRLRTLILDAAYNLDQDPWYRDLNRAMVEAFRFVCERDAGCNALGGDPIARMRALADSLAAEPLEGKAHDADGALQPVYLDPAALSYVTAAATYGVPIYRELDAAGRAYLEDGDPLPLLRIGAEQFTSSDAGPIEEYSEGLYVAVACNDYPQLWDISASPAERTAQYEQSLAQLRANDAQAFAPFTIDEWLASPWTAYQACLGWPAPSTWIPPVPEPHIYPDIPTLVLVGDVDSITSPEGARIVAERFSNSTLVEVANVAHVTALVDYSRCASDLVLTFVSTGGDAGNTTCASRYNEIRVTEQFPKRLADVLAAPGTGSGNRGRAVTAAAHTVADMMARWWTMVGEEGVGLRGGDFTTTGIDRVRFNMDRLRWVENLRVSGTVRWDRFTGAIVAKVDLEGASTGSLSITWNDWDRLAQARARGTIGGEPVDWTFPAP